MQEWRFTSSIFSSTQIRTYIVWLADHFVDTVIANFETFDPACQNPQIYEAFDNVINAVAA